MADLEDLLKRAGDARGPDGLARVWRRAKPGFTRPLRMKDLGKLGQMIRACEGDAPRAARALAVAVVGWDEFRSRAGAADLQRDVARQGPGAPHVGFLLEHFEVAVAMAEQPRAERPPTCLAPPTRGVVQPEMDEEERADYLRFLEEN